MWLRLAAKDPPKCWSSKILHGLSICVGRVLILQLREEVDSWCIEPVFVIVQKPDLDLAAVVARCPFDDHLLDLEW